MIWKKKMTDRKKIVLTIAGSDPSGGAGIQADIKTASLFDIYSCAVIIAITAQNTQKVSGIWGLNEKMVRDQLESVLSDITPDAVKIGLIPNPDTANIIAEILIKYSAKNIIVDPVLSPTLIKSPSDKKFIKEIVTGLFPIATLVTPNVLEKQEIEKTMEIPMEILCNAFLLKGGHTNGKTEIIDYLFFRKDNDDILQTLEFKHPRINTNNTHGSGCVLSTAIACLLAKGESLESAVDNAIKFTHTTMESSKTFNIGNGKYGPTLC